MKIGTIAYATEQGIGYLAKDFYDHGIIDEVLVRTYPRRDKENHPEWYPRGPVLGSPPFPKDVVTRFLRDIDILLVFETPFDWDVLAWCRELGKKSVLVPMYEWAPLVFPHLPDAFFCPSLLDVQYFHEKYKDGNGKSIPAPFLQVPVKLGTWKQRVKAHRFLHNAGNLGSRWHKGTLEILQALPMIQSPIKLTVRAQDVRALEGVLVQVGGVLTKDSRLTIERGAVNRNDLFDDNYDVFLFAEKYNGLSLPLQEARAAGMLVMTSDRFPMNTWLPNEPLIQVETYTQVQAAGGHQWIAEAKVTPLAIAVKVDEWYDRDINDYSRNGYHWSKENSWEALKPLWQRKLEEVVHGT